MDCNNARLLLDFARPVPGELDAAEAAALQQHLSQCPDCEVLAQSERRFDQALGQVMKAVPVPDGLRTRLLAELDRRRDAWYRRFLFTRVLPGAAAAAAVLLVVFLGWQHWREQQKIWFDGNPLVGEMEERSAANHILGPEDRLEVKNRVESWLRKVGDKSLSAPPTFRYDLLDNYVLSDLEDLKIQRVPTLAFLHAQQGSAYSAYVYVLSGKRFDLPRLRNQTFQETGNIKLKVLDDRYNQEVLFLVRYSGPSLKSFLTGDPPL